MALLVREPLPALHVPFPLGGHCTGSRRRRPGAAPRSPSRRGAEGEVVSGHGLALPTRLHLLLQKRTGRLPVLACAQLVVLIRCMGPVDGPEHSACMIRPTWRRQDGFRGRGSGSDVSARSSSVCWTRAIAAAPAIAAPIAERGGGAGAGAECRTWSRNGRWSGSSTHSVPAAAATAAIATAAATTTAPSAVAIAVSGLQTVCTACRSTLAVRDRSSVRNTELVGGFRVPGGEGLHSGGG